MTEDLLEKDEVTCNYEGDSSLCISQETDWSPRHCYGVALTQRSFGDSDVLHQVKLQHKILTLTRKEWFTISKDGSPTVTRLPYSPT